MEKTKKNTYTTVGRTETGPGHRDAGSFPRKEVAKFHLTEKPSLAPKKPRSIFFTPEKPSFLLLPSYKRKLSFQIPNPTNSKSRPFIQQHPQPFDRAMARILPPCPPNSFSLNSTVCVCNPGYFMNPARNDCTLFTASPNEWAVGSGVEYGPFFPETIFSFDSIKKFTQSQAIFLEATMVVLVSWLAFCLAVRFRKIDRGRTIWFRIRWWISRWDVCYATRHWLDDRKVVTKRKTELGGSFSVASWILFIGLLAALLYQIITKRTVEVHKIKPANGPDLSSFINDMEFNITTISSMSCSHLRGLGTLVTGTPGFVDYRVSPLSIFASYYCQNTSRGPTVTLKCSNCQVPRDGYYISWQFVDLPNDPATAVGFQFNLTAKKHGDNKHVSFVTGILKSRGNMDERPNTFRGADVNVLKFHLFPRVYRNLNNLSLLQPLFRDFLPGSSFFETSQLKTSLQSSKDGLINTTLHVNFISDYIIEIDNENALGPVGFLANVGGLYVFSITVFFYCMSLFEHRIKKLRHEDAVLRDIRSRRRAQLHWDKLRKYVTYTWGPDDLDGEGKYSTKEQSCGKSFHGIGSLHKQKTQSRMDSIKIDKSIGSTIETKIIPGATQTEMVKTCLAQGTSDLERKLSKSEGAHVLEHGEKKVSSRSYKGHSSQNHVLLPDEIKHPLPPVPEFPMDGGANISDIQRNLQNMYDYNVCLRERFMDVQSMLDDLLQKTSPPTNTHPT